MIDYSEWERRRLSVDAVRLDKENPRLPEDMLNESQPNIIEYLVSNFNVLDIAKSIAENGFFINELPIVVKKGRHFIVIEGNRRLTALKLLRNPELAPARKKHTYSRLAENIDTSRWEKLDMYIAPTRESVAPILIARHGTEMTSPWQRIMKMRFLAGDVIRGVAHEDIALRYSVNIGEVRTAAITILMRELIRSADISDQDKDDFLSEKFQTSTLSRIIETKHFSDVFQLQLVGSALKFGLPKEEFTAVIVQICKDIVSEKVTHRSHDKREARVEYIDSLYKDIASGKKEDSKFEAPPKKEDTDKEEPRKPRPRVKSEKLIPHTMQYLTGLNKLDELIQEAQKMSVAAAPHAGGLLLRAILDLTVQRLFEIKGRLEETKNGSGRTNKLTARITRLVNTHSDWFTDVATCEKLKRFADHNSTSFVHIETLNDYVHGTYGKPTKDDLHNFWGQILPLVDLILEE